MHDAHCERVWPRSCFSTGVRGYKEGGKRSLRAFQTCSYRSRPYKYSACLHSAAGFLKCGERCDSEEYSWLMALGLCLSWATGFPTERQSSREYRKSYLSTLSSTFHHGVSAAHWTAVLLSENFPLPPFIRSIHNRIETLQLVCHLINMSDDDRQGPNRGRDGAEAAGEGGVADANASGNNNGRIGGHRARVRPPPPPPFWLRRDGENGPLEQVERTPLNVIHWELDYPYQNVEEVGGTNEDISYSSSESDDTNNVVEPARALDPGRAVTHLGSLIDRYQRYRLRDLTVTFAADERRTGNNPSELADDFRDFANRARVLQPDPSSTLLWARRSG